MSRPSLLKKIQVYLFGSLAAVLIRCIYATIRWQVVSPTDDDKNEQVIYAFWHGRMLMLPPYYAALKRRPLYMLISQHGDGRLIAFAIKLLGIRSVAGSSSRRGVAAMLEMIRRLEDGGSIGITPDGPKGPYQVCKKGVIALAAEARVPIRPITYSVQERWVIPSWDRMIVPRPFSRGVIVVGNLVPVGEGEDENTARLRVEEALNGITSQADRHWDAV